MNGRMHNEAEQNNLKGKASQNLKSIIERMRVIFFCRYSCLDNRKINCCLMARLLKQGSMSALRSYKPEKNYLIGGNWSTVPPRVLLHMRIGRMKIQGGQYRVCSLVLNSHAASVSCVGPANSIIRFTSLPFYLVNILWPHLTVSLMIYVY